MGRADQGVRGPQIPWLEAGQPDIAPPTIPWLEAGGAPVGGSCPNGWRAVHDVGVTTCDPYPQSGALDCPPGETHFPGEAGCSPVGRACAAGPFPSTGDVPSTTPRVFVLAAAEAGGSGSESSPVRTLAAALELAVDGALVVLGAGIYEVDRAWPDGVSIRGLCARESFVVVADGSERSAVLDIDRHASPVRVESLTVGPAPVVGLRIRRPGAVVTLDGVRVEGVTGDPAAVVVASAAEVEARSIVIRGRRPGADGEGGAGLRIEARGRLSLERAVLVENLGVGVSVSDDGTRAALEDVVVRDTLVDDGRSAAAALFVGQGARLELRRGLLERSRGLGASLGGDGTEALLEDLIVRETLAARNGELGHGVEVVSGARVELQRGLVERSRSAGVLVAEEGSAATLEDLVVRGTLAGERDGASGYGVSVQRGAVLELRRSLVQENRASGVRVARDGTLAVLEDVVVRETLPQLADGDFGMGLDVQRGARLELRRGLVERSRTAGVFVGGAGTEAVLQDLVLRRTLPQESDGRSAGGLAAQNGARVELRRGLLEQNREAGVLVALDGAEALLEDVVIRDTLVRETDGALGRGLNIQLEARAELRRGLVEHNRDVGVLALERARFDGEDVVIRRTTAPDCHPDCERGSFGVNLGSYTGSTVELGRFELASAELCGVQIGADARVRLTGGVVRDHPIAVCLRVPRPTEPLRQGVDYVDNGELVDTWRFPTPDPIEGLDLFEP